MKKTSSRVKKKKQAKNLNKIDIILIILGLFIVVFVATMIITFWKFQQVPDTLISCLLGSSAIELIATTCIKIFSNKHDDSDDEE